MTWIDATIKRLIKKRHKLYLRARKSKDPVVKIHYKRFRAHVQKVLRDAYWKYVSNISKPEKTKKIWSFIKSLKKTRLRSHHSEKTEFLRQILRKKPTFVIGNFNQHSYVKTTLTRPQNGASLFSSMGDITGDRKGVSKLLDGLNVHKASGPDGLIARVLKECSNEISPILYQQSTMSLKLGRCTR